MEFSDMVKKSRESLQARIDDKAKILYSLAEPIKVVLRENKLSYKQQIRCADKIPYKIVLDIRRPEIRVEIREKGFTLYEDHYSQWADLRMRDISLELATQYLADLVAKSQVRVPC